MFAFKRTSLGSVLDCVAPCLEESLLSLAKLRLEEVWKSFTEHTKWMFGSRTTVKKVRNSLTWFVVEIRAGHRVGQEGQCGTIQEDSCQELASVVMEKIYTEEISMEVQLKE